MTLITPPAALPVRRIQWQLRQPAQLNRSGWTGRRQVVGLPGGAMWSASGEFTPIVTQADVLKWRGFFTSLRGPFNTFNLTAVEEAQHALSQPTITAGSAGAFTATMTGLPVSATLLPAGSYMTIKLSDASYQLVCLTAALAGNGSGNGTATFVPALRNSAATGAGSAETISPWCVVSMASDTWGYDVEPGQIYGIGFQVEEVL